MLLCWSCCSELCLRCCHFPNKVGIPNDNYILNSRAPRSSWPESHLQRRDWAWNGDIDSNKYWMLTRSLWETAQCRSFSSRLWSCGNNLVQSNDMNDTINLDVLLKTTCSLLRRLQTVFGWGCQQSVATIEGELQSGWLGSALSEWSLSLARLESQINRYHRVELCADNCSPDCAELTTKPPDFSWW